MDKILSLIQKETTGKCYTSYKFCVDDYEVPSLKYEEAQSFTLLKERYGESDTSLVTSKNLANKAKQYQGHKPLFSYFLDGGRRVYKIDDIEVSRKIFPIIAGQIGVACCERLNPDSFKKALLEHNLVIALPYELYTDEMKYADQFFATIIEKINDLKRIKNSNLRFSKALPYKTNKLEGNEKFEDRGIARIQDEMIECEKKIVAELVKKNKINYENYLLKDGSLQYKPVAAGNYRELSKLKANYQCVVGLSKSFNPELSKDRSNKSNASNIAKLPLFHRTPAFMYQTDIVGADVFFAIWYLRIRETKYSDSPFAGVVKLEKVLVSEKERENGLDTDEVDMISANIINERNPVCYGQDSRWANHLYPIFLTESFIKSNYISDLHLLNLF